MENPKRQESKDKTHRKQVEAGGEIGRDRRDE